MLLQWKFLKHTNKNFFSAVVLDCSQSNLYRHCQWHTATGFNSKKIIFKICLSPRYFFLISFQFAAPNVRGVLFHRKECLSCLCLIYDSEIRAWRLFSEIFLKAILQRDWEKNKMTDCRGALRIFFFYYSFLEISSLETVNFKALCSARSQSLIWSTVLTKNDT